MASFFPECFLVSAHQPSEIAVLLKYHAVVPAGPYYGLDNNGSCPSHMCDLDRLRSSTSEVTEMYRKSARSELTTASRNIIIYICAGLLKHKALLNRYPGLDERRDPVVQFQTIHNQGLVAIHEAFSSHTITPAQRAWIEAEQSRSIKVVTRYPEVLDEACETNNSMFHSMYRMVEKVESVMSRTRIEFLLTTISDLSTNYIDLKVYGRPSSKILNTALPRFRKVKEQEEHKRHALEFLHNKLEAAYHAVFAADDRLTYVLNQT